MTNIGAFAYFTNDGNFTLKRRTIGSQNQTTGARIPSTVVTATIKGSLDALTEEDLRNLPVGFYKEGMMRFFSARSYDIDVQDIIIHSDGRKFRVLQQLIDPPIINRYLGSGGEAIGFYVELTRSDV